MKYKGGMLQLFHMASRISTGVMVKERRSHTELLETQDTTPFTFVS
jgi:hypothetical protein